MSSLAQDLRYAFRSLRQRPLFALVTIATLALGIGANTAIFSVVDAVMLKPLAYDHADALITVRSGSGHPSADAIQMSFPVFEDLRSGARSLAQVATFRYWLFNVSGNGHPESVLGVYAGDSLFQALRAVPALGRFFAAGADGTGASRDVVLSYAFWRRRFNADPAIVGQQIVVNGAPSIVIGVLPSRFQFPQLLPGSVPMPSREPDVYLPIGSETDHHDQRSSENYWIIGRLAPGVSLGAAAADLARVAHNISKAYPAQNGHLELVPVPLKEQVVGESRKPLIMLFGAVILVLLIAAANVGGLTVARAIERRREVGIRVALGASRARLARQLLVESLVLAAAGGTCGVALASWGVQLLRGLAPESIPRVADVTIDTRVLAFTALVAVVTGVLFGLTPLLQRDESSPAQALRNGSRSNTASGGRLRAGLVIGEVALALALLSGAGLLLRSFSRLLRVEPGFKATNVMTMFTLPPAARYSTPALRWDYQRRLLQSIHTVHGVTLAGTVNTLPLSNLGSNTSMEVVGQARDAERPPVDYRTIGGEYFEAMGIPLAAGRFFSVGDSAGAPLVAIVNAAFVRKYLGGRDPIGRQIRIYLGDDSPRSIVGVVGDTHGTALETDAAPEMSIPAAQSPDVVVTLVVRTAGNPVAILPEIRHSNASVDPDLAFYAERTMDQLVDASLATRRFNLSLLGGFAALALVLAAIGLYGVIAFSVSQRSREMGIRSALGAGRQRIVVLILREGATLGGIGLGLGAVLSVAVAQGIRSMLFGVPAIDPISLGGAVVALASVMLFACYFPARRAASIDPVEAIRRE